MIEQKAFEQFIGSQFGPYRIEQFIEEQHRSLIFLARTGESSGSYLVRLLMEPTRLQGIHRDEYLTSFQHKASQIATLQHPYLLSIIDYGVQHDLPFLVTPQVAMQSFHAHLDKNGPMDVTTAGRYLDQICSALAYAHQHGVIHGSLSIDCIHLRADGQILVENTGLTNLLALHHNGGQPDLDAIAGEGIAPEQLLGKPVGSFTDVYALGAVLYHILTGAPVFSGRTSQELAQQHLFTPVPPLRQRSNNLPPGLYSIFARAMAKNPTRRFLQPDALANAYHRIVDSNNGNHAQSAIISSPAQSVQLPFVIETTAAEGQLTQRDPDSNESAIGDGNNLHRSPLPPSLIEDLSDSPTLKRVPALQRSLRHRPVSSSLEKDLPDTPTLPGMPASHKEEDLLNAPTLPRVPALPELVLLPPALKDLPDTAYPDPSSAHQLVLAHQLERQNRNNRAIMLLLLLIASATVGAALFARQHIQWTGIIGTANSKLLLGVCIVLAIAFTVGFNIISRISLSTTKHEYAYTILWQLSCALLVPFFLPFDGFSININPHVLLLFALSIVLWALVDAFMFSSFKYEEASVLSSIFPLNFVFTFLVSIVFFHSAITPPTVIGFLIIMTASLLIGLRYTRLRLSKGIVFALLYSVFQGAALGFNSAVVKSFSIPPYMFAAFLFPAIANLFVFLRPKVSEMRYELQVQWKKILLNAVVMDLSFFFLLKAYELGNVPQVVALSASSTLLTALAGIVILKEDTHIALKIMAAALATLGIILVQL